VTGTATLLLNAQPHRNAAHQVLSEALNLGTDQPVEQYPDAHGNRVYRLDLHRGTHVFHHDALVAVSSLPDNAGFDNAAPAAVGTLPSALLRYTLPSRYCDSDRLTNFAWQQ